jgi:hypothetical protein
MTSGVGNLIGFLGVGYWFNVCTQPAGVRWPLFWSGLAAAVGGVMIYFLLAYRGKGSGLAPREADTTSVTSAESGFPV